MVTSPLDAWGPQSWQSLGAWGMEPSGAQSPDDGTWNGLALSCFWDTQGLPEILHDSMVGNIRHH